MAIFLYSYKVSLIYDQNQLSLTRDNLAKINDNGKRNKRVLRYRTTRHLSP